MSDLLLKEAKTNSSALIPMQTLNAARSRWGAMALGIAALLLAAFPIVRPFFPNPDVNSPASLPVAAQALTSSNWVVAHLMAMVAMVLLLVGLLAVYVHLIDRGVVRPAFPATILSFVGIALILPTLGVETYALPVVGKLYLDGQTKVISAVGLIHFGPNILLLILGLLCLAIGAIVLAIANWQSGILPKWAGVIFAVGLALWFPLFPQIIRIVDGLLIGIGGVWLAWSIWQKV